MFTLHPTLAADTVEIADAALVKILLIKDANYPWLILVPRKPDLSGLHELSPEDGKTLMADIRNASNALKNLYNPDRINVAALGNVVPQLHVHVIARFETDAAWPAPVWGVVPAKKYDDDKLRRTVAALKEAL